MLLKTMNLQSKVTFIATLVSLGLIGAWGWKFYGMRVKSHLPIWAAALLTLPVLCPLALIWLLWSVSIRRQEILAVGCTAPFFIIAIFASQSLGPRIADHYYLVYLYGPDCVRTEQLRLVRPRKNFPPWRVFRGDREIDQRTDYSIWNNINDAVWTGVSFTTLTTIFWILPRRPQQCPKRFENR